MRPLCYNYTKEGYRMRHYQSVIALALLIALVLSLSGCIVIPKETYYDLDPEEVESVWFYELKEPIYHDHSGSFEGESSPEPVFILPQNRNKAFLKDFADLRFTDVILITVAAVDPSFSYGNLVVRINFTNGRYTCYSCLGYGATYDADGSILSITHYSCEEEDLAKLIKKYMEFQKPENIILK